MFSKDDEKYLVRLIGSNQVVLFLGSGFTSEALNRMGEPFPLGRDLSIKLWDFLGYRSDYDETKLPEMYQAFLSSPIKLDRKKEFLENTLLASTVEDVYLPLTCPFWYKIYTTNIDDILSITFKRARKRINEIKFPEDEYCERDQSLDSTLVVYLHGKLPSDPMNVIFSSQQYAVAQLRHQPLYSQFVYDYSIKPTIFLGTDLTEPLFERYIEEREGKFGYRELRPRSFIIVPSLSPVKIDNLRSNFNVHFVQGTTKDFLDWTKQILPELPDQLSILKRTFPNLVMLIENRKLEHISSKVLREFAHSFTQITARAQRSHERSAFLLGASPRMSDIHSEIDIPRSITKAVIENIEETLANANTSQRIKLFCIHGYAGSGKSTILQRLGLMLSQNGRIVFLSYSDFIPRSEDLVEVINSFEERIVILFDNARNILAQLPSLFLVINSNTTYPPIIILTIRSNYLDNLNFYIDPDIVDIVTFSIPDLDDNEINHLIQKLNQYNLLGILKGKSESERFRAFKIKANRQILIAMKEATRGMPFEEIIRDEYNSIAPEEARILSVCIALNTELGFSNTKQDLVGFSKASHIETLNYLERNLRGTIMWVENQSQFMLRHRVLADFFIRNCASLVILKEAYIRVLSVLAPELKRSHSPSRKFNLYKSLINHKVLYHRFSQRIDLAREVYESITDYFADDAHFWLQYGSLETEGEGGNLNLAENYLSQAESLAPDYSYIQNAKCNLFYKLALVQENIDKAKEVKYKADTLGNTLLLTVGRNESHIYHIICGGRFHYIRKWITDISEKKEELKALKRTISTARTLHPRDKKLDEIFRVIQKAYLELGMPDGGLNLDIPNLIEE